MAERRAIDQIRRSKRLERNREQLARELEQPADDPRDDDLLRLLARDLPERDFLRRRATRSRPPTTERVSAWGRPPTASSAALTRRRDDPLVRADVATLPDLLAGRTRGPVFLAERRPVPARMPPAADVCPDTGRGRLSCPRAEYPFKQATRPLDPSGADYALSQLKPGP